MNSLIQDSIFDLIPDCPAATAAGYTGNDRDKANVWYGPTIDQDKFYYCAYAENKSSLLVCRELKDASLVYAVNCQDYNLDTSNTNYLGESGCIPRNKPKIVGDRIYLTSGLRMTNIGPQLYAIDKYTGDLIWALGYYPPNDLDPITEKKDYSDLIGSNARVSNLELVVKDIRGKRIIFVGSSSNQHAYPRYNDAGFPVYTDQGFLGAIVDNGNEGLILWKAMTCAPILKIGDTISNDGPDHLNPFRKGKDTVAVAAISQGSINLPLSMNGVTPIAAIYSKNLQDVWYTKDLEIYIDIDPQAYTLNEVIQKLDEDTTMHTIHANIDTNMISGNNPNVLYFKELPTGYTIQTQSEADGLNYWGNNVWGGEPHIDNIAIFGTGQTHSLPLDELMYFNERDDTFVAAYPELLNQNVKYVNGEISLSQYVSSRDKFTKTVHDTATNLDELSPRGRMSYPDSIMGVDLDGKFKFGVRAVAWDSYNIIPDNPVVLLYPFPVKTLDGDFGSGIAAFRDCKGVHYAGATKSGLILVIHKTRFGLSSDLIYGGPYSVIGGSNYQTGSDKKRLYVCQANRNWSREVDPEFIEKYVNKHGKVYDTNNSIIQSIDPFKARVDMEIPLYNSAVSQVEFHDNIYVNDFNGNLYIISSKGELVWKGNGSKLDMLGGIATPAICGDYVVWMNNYQLYGLTVNGGHGVIYKQDRCLQYNSIDYILNKRYYESWDTAPKKNIKQGPVYSDVQKFSVSHMWEKIGCKIYLVAQHDVTLRFQVSKIRGSYIYFWNNQDIKYKYIRLINPDKYELHFFDKEDRIAWLE